jgi:hypothetical protein
MTSFPRANAARVPRRNTAQELRDRGIFKDFHGS